VRAGQRTSAGSDGGGNTAVGVQSAAGAQRISVSGLFEADGTSWPTEASPDSCLRRMGDRAGRWLHHVAVQPVRCRVQFEL
jgi:hypothetical protein